MMIVTEHPPLPHRQTVSQARQDERTKRLQSATELDNLAVSNVPLPRVNPHKTRNRTMPKIAVTTEELTSSRAAKVNPYDALVASFNDGQTRTMSFDLKSENPMTELEKLRRAAKDVLGRSVRCDLVKGEDGSWPPSFRFKLVDLIERKRGMTTVESAPEPEAPKPKGK